MTKYLRILNTADNVSRLGLEKLGLSTKRDDPNTIGRFGSGIKFAPIFALRQGWDWIFTGSDDYGPYTMRYIVKKDHGIDCIWYDYGDEVKPSSFTIDAGGLSWTDFFQIYREAVSNAMDGAKQNNGVWGIDIVDKVFNEEGFFSVFITASPEMMTLFRDHDKYFSVNRRQIFDSPLTGDRILEKIDDNCRIYCHDVLVYSKDNQPSIFDYCFDNIELNEERTIKNIYSAKWAIENILSETTSEEVISSVIDAASDPVEYIEFDSGMYRYVSKNKMSHLWSDLFYQKYGENAVILDKTMQKMNLTHLLRVNGYSPVNIYTDSAFTLLKNADIADAFEKLGESVKYDIDDDISSYGKLSKAISIARLAEPKLSIYADKIGVFKSEDDSVLGVTINMDAFPEDRRILIARHHALDSSIEQIIATLLHEYDHASTGCSDGFDATASRFRDIADQRIGKLVFENYKNCPVEIRDGMLICDPSNVDMIGTPLRYSYEYSNLLGGYIIQTAKMNFIVKSTFSVQSNNDVSLVMSPNAEYFIFSEIIDPKEISIG